MLTAGVDLAAEPKGTALAIVDWTSGSAKVLDLQVGVSDEPIVKAASQVDKLGIDSVALLNLREVGRESKTKRDSGTPFIKVTYQAELPYEDLYEPDAEQRIVVRYEIGGRRQKRDFGEIISFENGTVTFTRESLNGLSNVKPNAILEAQTFNTSAKQSNAKPNF